MKLKRENIEITIDETKGEFKSIIIDNNEILYQGDQIWKKTFPILFPAVGLVKKWEVNGKLVDMPKHGFWNELKWDAFYDAGDVVLNSICVNKIVPYTFDIELRIAVQKSRVTITASITNASLVDAYFHFGWHPAFKATSASVLLLDHDEEMSVINPQGLVVPNSIYFISNKKISQLPFGKDVDSLISIDTSINKVTLVNQDYNLNLYFDAPNIVFWKKPTDNFICVEPYYGYSDAFDAQFPSKIEDKQDIIKLGSSDTFTSMYVIEYLKKS